MKATILASQEALTKHHNLRDSATNLLSHHQGDSDKALLQLISSRRSEQNELVSQIAIEVKKLLSSLVHFPLNFQIRVFLKI